MKAKSEKKAKATAQRIRPLVRYMERQYMLLKSVEASQEVLETYLELLTFLEAITDDMCDTVFPSTKLSSNNPELPLVVEESDESIQGFTAEHVEKLLNDDKSSRNLLDRIAKLRFGLTSSAISNLRNRDALIQKLKTMIKNERGHDSIARLTQPSDHNK